MTIVNKPILLYTLSKNDVLAGMSSGQKTRGQILEDLSQTASNQVVRVLLDFRAIKVATGSYLREAVIFLRDELRHRRTSWYPVAVNLSPPLLEELQGLLTDMDEAFPVAVAQADGTVGMGRVLGRLEPRQLEDLMLVTRLKRVRARDMASEPGSADIGLTGWSNRLATLHRRGFLIEHVSGRDKAYTPILEGFQG